MVIENRVISVVIPTYNRQPFLQKCLESLLNQSYPSSKYEIIIVDDCSKDMTHNCVKLFMERPNAPRIVYLSRQNNKGPAAARNLGVNNAKGGIIAFIDDDCIASLDWLECIVAVFSEKPDISVCGTPCYSTEDIHSADLKPAEEKYLQFEYAPLSIISTNNCALYKNVFDKIGGFDELFNYGGEDPDLVYRLLKSGYKVYKTSKLIVFHHPKTGFREMARQSYIFSFTDSLVLKKHFQGWFIVNNYFINKLVNGRGFYYIKNSPVTGYIRIDSLKVLILLLFLAFYINIFITLILFLVLFILGGIKKGFRNILNTMRYQLIYDTFYLCGHIRGSITNKIIYL